MSSLPVRPAALTAGILWALSAFSQGARADPPADPPPRQTGKVVPYVATPANVVAEMLRLGRLTGSDVLYDLGCGDGRIVITAARLARARGVGVDIDAARVRESLRNAGLAGVDELVSFRQADLFDVELREATLVTLYLLPAVNERLRPKLLRELRPGARVVSNSHGMGDWKPDQTSRRAGASVHLWVVPANASGRWSFRLPDGSDDRYHLQVRQRYQEVQVSLRSGRRSVPVRGAHLRGDRLTFTASLPGDGGPVQVRFDARVSGDRLVGGMRSAAAQARLGVETAVGWRAHRDPATVAAIDGTGAL